jgi:hypothetical protein
LSPDYILLVTLDLTPFQGDSLSLEMFYPGLKRPGLVLLPLRGRILGAYLLDLKVIHNIFASLGRILAHVELK